MTDSTPSKKPTSTSVPLEKKHERVRPAKKNGKPSGLSVDSNEKNNVSKEQHRGASRKKIDKEIGGPKGLEPTRYGDWERNGRCYDF